MKRWKGRWRRERKKGRKRNKGGVWRRREGANRALWGVGAEAGMDDTQDSRVERT